jgi:L-2-hydroxyglutarate oxidase LhgO
MDVQTVVVGAGVVGLAVARALALSGREVLVLEAESSFGQGISSRNSEVIHSGIYYAPGSLKARLCVAGREQLYAYCAERGIAHRQLGKLIVATSDADIATLERYRELARANGAGELRWVPPAEVREMEPEVVCVRAIHAPRTGIVDSHALMLALLGDLEARGGQVAYRSPLLSGAAIAGGFELRVGGDEPSTLACAELVNCAGLAAPDVARTIDPLHLQDLPKARYAKGHYYSLTGAAPFRRLVYPVAEAAGLGVHVTLDLGGRAKFGPDVQWVESVDYAFDDTRRARFAAAIRRYWPAVDEARLQPDYTGIRPKISGPGEPAADFRIDGPDAHGIAGLVNLMGIESPGLTAALAIGERVRDMLGRSGR